MPTSRDVIHHKEQILGKLVLPGLEMEGGDGKGRFAAIGHLHSYTRAFGDPEERDGIWTLKRDVIAQFELPEDFASRAHELKLIAMMEHWTNWAVDIDIILNGHVLRSGKMLFENVVSGWPANSLHVEAKHLVQGINRVVIRNNSRHGGSVALFINKIEIVTRAVDRAFQFELAPRVVRVGEECQLRVRNVTGRKTTVGETRGFTVVASERQQDDDVFTIRTARLDNDQSIAFSDGPTSLVYAPERVVHAERPYRQLIGTDLNDDRMDETTPRLIDFFNKTEMGNVIGFRVHIGRNCHQAPLTEDYNRWLPMLRERKMFWWMENGAFKNPLFLAANPLDFRPSFAATKFHEFTHSVWDLPTKPTDLKHGTELFFQHVMERKEKNGIPGVPFWVAEASFKLCLIAASPHCDLPVAEPSSYDHVSCYAAIKRSARIHGKEWGNHVAVQWYMGQGNTDDKLRRLRITLHLSHMQGAQLIYTESGLFKYVQFSQRWDSEHPFTRSARDTLREFFAFTKVQEVHGELQSSINVLYGNLDSTYFYPDLIPLDTDKSQGLRRLWYKWERTAEDFGWMAAQNLFRPLRQQGLKGYPGDQGQNPWFSSNPFGGVDIISVNDLLKSPLPVSFILGRNIMTDEVHQQLLTYVSNGGTLFMTAHQGNTQLDPEQERTYFRNGDFTELFGFALAGGEAPVTAIATSTNGIFTWPKARYVPTASDTPLCAMRIRQAGCTVLAQDETTGAPLVVGRSVGKGTVICYVGSTPLGHAPLRVFVDDLVKAIAATAHPEVRLANDAEVYVQEWRTTENGITQSKIFLLNINWTTEFPHEVARLAVGSQLLDIEVPLGPPRVLYRVDGCCFGATSPYTQIWDIRISGKTLRFKSLGRDLDTFTCLPAIGTLQRVVVDGAVIPHGTSNRRSDIGIFACILNAARDIELTFA